MKSVITLINASALIMNYEECKTCTTIEEMIIEPQILRDCKSESL